MDDFEQRDLETSRGFKYRYYVSPPVTDTQDSKAPVLLLCHGFPDDAHMWQFVVSHLMKSKLKIIVPDLLGYGGTSKPTDPASYEIKGMVQDVTEICKAEGVEESILPIGHDWLVHIQPEVEFAHQTY